LGALLYLLNPAVNGSYSPFDRDASRLVLSINRCSPVQEPESWELLEKIETLVEERGIRYLSRFSAVAVCSLYIVVGRSIEYLEF
jgi:hypothetical protein